MAIPTKPLYAFSNLRVIGPGIDPSPMSDPLTLIPGQMQKLVEVTKAA